MGNYILDSLVFFDYTVFMDRLIRPTPAGSWLSEEK